MLRLFVTCALLGAVVALAAPATSAAPAAPRPRLSAPSPDGRRLAEVRRRATGGEALYVDGRAYWPPADARIAPRITTSLVWSRGGDALAFVANEAGRSTLVVALVDGEGAPMALSWPIPTAAGPARAIMWLGSTRVAVGPRELEPKVVASWSTSR